MSFPDSQRTAHFVYQGIAYRYVSRSVYAYTYSLPYRVDTRQAALKVSDALAHVLQSITLRSREDGEPGVNLADLVNKIRMDQSTMSAMLHGRTPGTVDAVLDLLGERCPDAGDAVQGWMKAESPGWLEAYGAEGEYCLDLASLFFTQIYAVLGSESAEAGGEQEGDQSAGRIGTKQGLTATPSADRAANPSVTTSTVSRTKGTKTGRPKLSPGRITQEKAAKLLKVSLRVIQNWDQAAKRGKTVYNGWMETTREDPIEWARFLSHWEREGSLKNAGVEVLDEQGMREHKRGTRAKGESITIDKHTGKVEIDD